MFRADGLFLKFRSFLLGSGWLFFSVEGHLKREQQGLSNKTHLLTNVAFDLKTCMLFHSNAKQTMIANIRIRPNSSQKNTFGWTHIFVDVLVWCNTDPRTLNIRFARDIKCVRFVFSLEKAPFCKSFRSAAADVFHLCSASCVRFKCCNKLEFHLIRWHDDDTTQSIRCSKLTKKQKTFLHARIIKRISWNHIALHSARRPQKCCKEVRTPPSNSAISLPTLR